MSLENHLKNPYKFEREVFRNLVANNKVVMPIRDFLRSTPVLFEPEENPEEGNYKAGLAGGVIIPIDLIRDEKEDVLRQKDKYTSFMDMIFVEKTKDGKIFRTPIDVKTSLAFVGEANPGQTSAHHMEFLLKKYPYLGEAIKLAEESLSEGSRVHERISQEGFFLTARNDDGISRNTLKEIDNYLSTCFDEKKTLFITSNKVLIQPRVSEEIISIKSDSLIHIEVISRSQFKREYNSIKRMIQDRGFYPKPVSIFSDLHDYTPIKSFHYDPFSNTLEWTETRISKLEKAIQDVDLLADHSNHKARVRQKIALIEEKLGVQEGEDVGFDREREARTMNKVIETLGLEDENELIDTYFSRKESLEYSMYDIREKIAILQRRLASAINMYKEDFDKYNESFDLEGLPEKKIDSFLNSQIRARNNLLRFMRQNKRTSSRQQSIPSGISGNERNAIEYVLKNYVSINKSRLLSRVYIGGVFSELNAKVLLKSGGLELLLNKLIEITPEIIRFRRQGKDVSQRMDDLIRKKDYAGASLERERFFAQEQMKDYAEKFRLDMNYQYSSSTTPLEIAEDQLEKIRSARKYLQEQLAEVKRRAARLAKYEKQVAREEHLREEGVDFYKNSLQEMEEGRSQIEQMKADFEEELRRIRNNYFGVTDKDGEKIKLGINDLMQRLQKDMSRRELGDEVFFKSNDNHIMYIDLNSIQGRATLFKPSDKVIKIVSYDARIF